MTPFWYSKRIEKSIEDIEERSEKKKIEVGLGESNISPLR
jgi:hypothetical protein